MVMEKRTDYATGLFHQDILVRQYIVYTGLNTT